MSIYSWELEHPMLITVRCQGRPVLRLSVHEVIESCSRNDIVAHVAECDRTPWLRRWTEEKHQSLIDILKK